MKRNFLLAVLLSLIGITSATAADLTLKLFGTINNVSMGKNSKDVFDYDSATGFYYLDLPDQFVAGTNFKVYDETNNRNYSLPSAQYGANVEFTAMNMYGTTTIGETASNVRLTIKIEDGTYYMQISGTPTGGNEPGGDDPQPVAANYSLSTRGIVDGTFTAAYDDNYKFEYDSDTKTWTKVITSNYTGNMPTYLCSFIIYKEGVNLPYGADYANYIVTDDFQAQRLTSDGSFFQPSSKFSNVTLTITEDAAGNPVLTAAGFNASNVDPEEPEEPEEPDTPVVPGIGKLLPSVTSPASGSVVTPVVPLEKIVFTFNQNENGIDRIARKEGSSLKIMKDGEVWQEIPTTDIELISINRNNPNQLEILTNPISEPGVYSLTLPQDFIELSTLSGGTLGSEETETHETPDYSKLRNAEYTLTFTVKDFIRYTISPAPGSDTRIDELKDVTLTYPEGAVVKTNPAFMSNFFSVSLHYVNMTALPDEETGDPGLTDVVISKYNVSFEGNVVRLTALSPSSVVENPTLKNVKYYRITVPSGAWIVEYNGVEEVINSMDFSEYLLASGANDNPTEGVQITPDASEALNAEAINELFVTYPETYTFNAWASNNPMGKREGYIVAYLRKVNSIDDNEGENVAAYKLQSVDTENRTLTLKMDGEASLFADGYYTIYLVNNLFKQGNTGVGNLYFHGYELTSKTAGIENIDNAATYDVYTLEGVCLGKGLDSVESLPAGIYVINGRLILKK